MADGVVEQPSQQPDQILAQAQSQRKIDPRAATEILSRSLEMMASQLGANVHPDLGPLWFEYGDLLLQLEEATLGAADALEGDACSSGVDNGCAVVKSAEANASECAGSPGAAVSQCTVEQKEDGAVVPTAVPENQSEAIVLNGVREEITRLYENQSEEEDDEDDEDDLLLAYESLEVARMCFELKPASATVLQARARVHARLADFELLQDRPSEAVSQCLVSLSLRQKAAAADIPARDAGAPCQSGSLPALAADVQEALAHLCRAVERSRKPIESLIEDDSVRQMVRAYILDRTNAAASGTGIPNAVESNDGGSQATPVLQVQTRSKKRSREGDNDEDTARQQSTPCQ